MHKSYSPISTSTHQVKFQIIYPPQAYKIQAKRKGEENKEKECHFRAIKSYNTRFFNKSDKPKLHPHKLHQCNQESTKQYKLNENIYIHIYI